ncbi:hypothetical protein KPL74_10960 [Bacillus sp. NP157]|nr:hypothetical protein KPL74_10960 [Bacillus sp. NP157]
MERRETAVVAANMWGSKEYQARAREAVPILVRQALAGQPIFYQTLAAELGMPNPRNLNYPLGSVGQTLVELGQQWGEPIPPLQCLVVNQQDATPGQGFGWFMPDPEGWKRMSPMERRRTTEQVMQQIYAYPKWSAVLAALKLEPVKNDFGDLLKQAASMRAGGEGEAHKRLKDYVRLHPNVVGAKTWGRPGRAEERLPSGDSLDVFFDAGAEWIAVEVKPIGSDEPDLARGLYQCVKYTAVLRAMVVADQVNVDARSVLVIEGLLTPRLRLLKTMLGVSVIEGFRVP